MSAPKVDDELHRASGVRNDHSVSNKFLRNVNLRPRRSLVAVHFTQRHRQRHVAWATTRLRWTQRQWNTVLFTDEFHFHVNFADGGARVWRQRIERFHPENVIQRDRYGGGSVMICGGISYFGKQASSQ
jgi:hypothetical protein